MLPHQNARTSSCFPYVVLTTRPYSIKHHQRYQSIQVLTDQRRKDRWLILLTDNTCTKSRRSYSLFLSPFRITSSIFVKRTDHFIEVNGPDCFIGQVRLWCAYSMSLQDYKLGIQGFLKRAECSRPSRGFEYQPHRRKSELLNDYVVGSTRMKKSRDRMSHCRQPKVNRSIGQRGTPLLGVDNGFSAWVFLPAVGLTSNGHNSNCDCPTP